MSGGAPSSSDTGKARALYNMQIKFSKHMIFLCAAEVV